MSEGLECSAVTVLDMKAYNSDSLFQFTNACALRVASDTETCKLLVIPKNRI